MAEANDAQPKTEWDVMSLREHGRVLTGLRSHYCWDWDGMTVDETTPEFEACSCFSNLPPPSKPVQYPEGSPTQKPREKS